MVGPATAGLPISGCSRVVCRAFCYPYVCKWSMLSTMEVHTGFDLLMSSFRLVSICLLCFSAFLCSFVRHSSNCLAHAFAHLLLSECSWRGYPPDHFGPFDIWYKMILSLKKNLYYLINQLKNLMPKSLQGILIVIELGSPLVWLVGGPMVHSDTHLYSLRPHPRFDQPAKQSCSDRISEYIYKI